MAAKSWHPWQLAKCLTILQVLLGFAAPALWVVIPPDLPYFAHVVTAVAACLALAAAIIAGRALARDLRPQGWFCALLIINCFSLLGQVQLFTSGEIGSLYH